MAPPPAGANGVIPVTVLQKQPPPSAPRHSKAPAPRLKLVCRRLPPGLTKSEFDTILGEEWKVGAGKVDWIKYRKGKISKDIAKPSKPSRAYLHVTQQPFAAALGDRVREATFHDAAKSFQDGALVGPPVLEFAPYPKTSGGRRRTDARQGTIDQDPDFKEFLESLTAPIAKPAAPEAETQKPEKVKTTPLIEALREKKANKDKPQGKKGRGDAKEDATVKKASVKGGKEAAAAVADKGRVPSKAEKEKAQKEAVKALNKEALAVKNPAAGTPSDKAPSATASPAPERRRGTVDLAKIQRDLGLGGAPNRRRGTKREVTSSMQDPSAQPDENAGGKEKMKEASNSLATAAPATNANSKKERHTRAERRAFKEGKAPSTDKATGKVADENAKPQSKPATTAPAPASTTASSPTILKKTPAAQAQAPTAPRGPASSRAPPAAPVQARNVATPPNRPANPTPAHAAPRSPASTSAPVGKQAFLKHANASQGITEPLIAEALKVFGAIEKVDIDARKGFCYVDFAESEGLRKAIAASPITVAQGAVQVLERKEKTARTRPFAGPNVAPARGRGGFGPRGRGGRGAPRGGGQAAPGTGPGEAQGSAPAPASTTTATSAAPAAVPVPIAAVKAGGDAAT